MLTNNVEKVLQHVVRMYAILKCLSFKVKHLKKDIIIKKEAVLFTQCSTMKNK